MPLTPAALKNKLVTFVLDVTYLKNIVYAINEVCFKAIWYLFAKGKDKMAQ